MPMIDSFSEFKLEEKTDLINHLISSSLHAKKLPSIKAKCKHDNQDHIVSFSYQLSIMGKESWIKPHRDKPTKLASILVYLPTKNQNNKPELGTTFYTAKANIDRSEFKGREHIDKLDISKSHDAFNIPFSSRQIVIFLRSDTSWHSVDYKKEDYLGERVSINLNLDIEKAC